MAEPSRYDFRYHPFDVEEDVNGDHLWSCASFGPHPQPCDCPPVEDTRSTAERLDAIDVDPSEESS